MAGFPVMEKAEIQRIADYLKELEEGLYEWDYANLPHSSIGYKAPY